MWIHVPRAVIPQLQGPGKFILTRWSEHDESYDVPLTVVETSRHGMRLVFGVLGPKTIALAGVPAGRQLLWRGPYPGGLWGLTRLRHSLRQGPGRAVVVARGMGQAVALPLVRSILAAPGWQVKLLVDASGEDLSAAMGWDAYSRQGDCSLGQIECYAAAGREALLRELTATGGRVVLASCGTDLLHRWVGAAWRELYDQGARGRDLPLLVASNNSLITCGEGSCGACTRRLPSGDRFRACKADCPPELLFAAPAGVTG